MFSRELTQEVEYPPTLPKMLSSIDLDGIQDKRLPFMQLESQIVRAAMAEPNVLTSEQVGWLRYVVSLARCVWIRTEADTDIYVEGILSRFRWFVKHELDPILARRYPMQGLRYVLPRLIQETQRVRDVLLEQTDLDALSLQEEVCNRQLLLALGGGGGSGFGYAGAMRTLHYAGIPIQMIAGTSIGSLIAMFRAKTRVFDQLPMLEAVRSLKWSKVLRALKIENRYGVPATLRLYLRSSLDDLLQTKSGRSMRFSDCEIPLLVVATGLTVDAFKHDLSFYEHLMDDAFVDSPRLFRQSSVRRIFRMTSTFYEFLSNPNALREVVFGADELTANADVIDAAGFSSAVTGLLHYDVLRDDPRMTRILDQMYGAFGITRLTEGGLVNNVPVKPLLKEVMRGRIKRRNPFVLALDCFSPQLTSMWYPVQKLIVPNVQANVRHADQYFSLRRRLAPINVVPTVDQAMMAMDWTSNELEPLMPYITRMCASHSTIPYESVSL